LRNIYLSAFDLPLIIFWEQLHLFAIRPMTD